MNLPGSCYYALRLRRQRDPTARAVPDVEHEIPASVRTIPHERRACRNVGMHGDGRNIDAVGRQTIEINSTEVVVADRADDCAPRPKARRLIDEDRRSAARKWAN